MSGGIVWDYAPSRTPNPAWQPTITSIRAEQFDDLRFAGSVDGGSPERVRPYGDDAEMSTTPDRPA